MTRYVILRAYSVSVAELLGEEGSLAPELTVWLPETDDTGALREFTAQGQEAALNQLENELPPDTSGTWKAVPLRSWKGGRTLQPLTRRERLPFKD